MTKSSRLVQFTVFTLLIPAGARADVPQADAAVAQSLFEQARQLLAEGRVTEACTKFAESQTLDPGGGTLLNLALCHEREGRLATAGVELESALSQAIRDNRKDREEIARAHILDLAPRMAKLVVEVVAPPHDLEILVDGQPLPRVAWGAATNIDPGERVVEARAPGRKSLSLRIEGMPRLTRRVQIPALEIDPDAEALPTEPAQATSAMSWPMVYLASDNPKAVLEEQRKVGPGAIVVTRSFVIVDDGTRWYTACGTPCARQLDPSNAYRVNGTGITPSAPFMVSSATGRVDLNAKTGSSTAFGLGVGMATVGVLGFLCGVTATLVGVFVRETDKSDADQKTTLRTVGIGTMAGTALLTIGGAVLAARSTTEVARDGAPLIGH